MAGLLLTASHGELTGRTLVGGRLAGEQVGRVALLLQDPLAGVVAETVGRDVAFGLENLSVSREEIWPRVRAAVEMSGFPYDVGHPTSALSGGETQRLVLAGALALGSSVLLLDEPTSMLDPESAASVRAAVRRETTRRGCTLVVVEHRLEPWLDFADRLVVLDAVGSIVADGPPGRIIDEDAQRLVELGVWLPGLPTPTPWTLDPSLVEPLDQPPAVVVGADEVTVRLRSGFAGWRSPTTTALDGVSTRLEAGRALGIVGASGAGKSTLTAVLAGLRRPDDGTVLGPSELATSRGREPWRWRSRDLARRLAWVPQTPEHGMVTQTVLDEVLATSRAVNRDEAKATRRAEGLLEALDLGRLAGNSPYHLSGGEQRRLMVAAGLAHGPMAALFDEPTVGQDRLTWAAVIGAMSAARDSGTATALASHDREAVDALADDLLELAHGRVAA
jgi:energy-coupling factor transporter ATP-binding protein EcfA2